MIILFTGHRDRITPRAELYNIQLAYPGAIWVHGGAEGFDSQVQRYAEENKISWHIVRPNYAAYGRDAPLVRNREMVDMADLVVACYEPHRRQSGTGATVAYAERRGKKVIVVEAVAVELKPPPPG